MGTSLIEANIAKRYALGLVKATEGEAEFLSIKSELDLFTQLMKKDDNFYTGISTLLFSKSQKKELLDTLKTRAGFSTKTYQFLITLVSENRLLFLPLITELYEKLWLERNNIEQIFVFSAVELKPELEKRLLEKLEKAFAKKVVIKKEVDPELIAGIKIQRGSIFYDFSLAGNLKKLEEVLIEES